MVYGTALPNMSAFERHHPCRIRSSPPVCSIWQDEPETLSHLVGGEAHASNACADSSPAPTAKNRGPRRQVFVAGVGVALGIGKPIPFEAGRTFGTCAFDSRRYRHFKTQVVLGQRG